MKANQAGIQIIKESESCRLSAYYCPAKIPTIGWGGTFYADGRPVKIGDAITQAEADELLKKLLLQFEKDVQRLVNVEINENQFSALVSFVYNVGARKFANSTLLRKVNEGNFVAAADEFARWNKSNGVVLGGLVTRRSKEKTLFTKPV